jgi:hypothetical protein
MILSRTLYYDKNEYNNGMGLGFYPTLSYIRLNNNTSIVIDFKVTTIFNDVFNKYIYCWIQLNGPVIYGFIEKRGEELLDSLNNEANVYISLIYNSGRRQIYPITINTTYYILENYHNKH